MSVGEILTIDDWTRARTGRSTDTMKWLTNAKTDLTNWKSYKGYGYAAAGSTVGVVGSRALTGWVDSFKFMEDFEVQNGTAARVVKNVFVGLLGLGIAKVAERHLPDGVAMGFAAGITGKAGADLLDEVIPISTRFSGYNEAVLKITAGDKKEAAKGQPPVAAQVAAKQGKPGLLHTGVPGFKFDGTNGAAAPGQGSFAGYLPDGSVGRSFSDEQLSGAVSRIHSAAR